MDFQSKKKLWLSDKFANIHINFNKSVIKSAYRSDNRRQDFLEKVAGFTFDKESRTDLNISKEPVSELSHYRLNQNKSNILTNHSFLNLDTENQINIEILPKIINSSIDDLSPANRVPFVDESKKNIDFGKMSYGSKFHSKENSDYL